MANKNLPFKIQKVAKACDRCRRRKIKCDATSPQCSSCAVHKVLCSFDHVEKRRAAPLKRRAENYHHLEKRLVQMEDFLNKLGMSFDGDMSRPQMLLATLPAKNLEVYGGFDWSPNTAIQSLRPPDFRISGDELHAEYFGQVSLDGLSNQSPQALSLSAGNPSSHNDLPKWNFHFPGSNLRKDEHLRLPPLDEMMGLLQIYFDNFNSFIPLFDQPSITSRLRHHYAQDGGSDLILWGALNVMLSVAFRLQAMSTNIGQANDRNAWKHMQNALSVVPELSLYDTDLLGVQTLLGMAIIFQGTFNPHPASTLIATAIKLLHRLGLHKNIPSSNTCAFPAEQRNRTLWIAYILDKSCSLQLDQPPLLHDDDLEVEVPDEDPADGLGLVPSLVETETLNLFRLRVHLAIIEDKIYSRLYSSQALKAPWQVRERAIQDLSHALERWKNGVPSVFRPEKLCERLPGSSVPHLVILHLWFFHCLTITHGVAFRSEDWVTSEYDPDLQQRHALKLCRPAARDAIRLMRLLPQGDFACVWLLLNPFLSSLFIILETVIHDPQDPEACFDLELVEPLLRLVGLLAENKNAEQMIGIRDTCASLERKARLAFDGHSACVEESSCKEFPPSR